MVRKNFWIGPEEYEGLRERAYRERRPEAEILREGLRLVLGLPVGQRAGDAE